jgi:hypothetical protein
MNITLTIPDAAADAWALRLANYNAGSGNTPVDLTGLLQIELDIETSKRVAEKQDTDQLALAADAELMALGLRAMDAPPEKRAAALAAASAALASAPAN